MKAFVTGGTGLLGSNLVRALLEQGHEVTCLVRDSQKARKIFGEANVALVEGDMREVEKFSERLAGRDVLFHVAAYFREYYQPGRSDDVMRLINEVGTLKLFAHAEQRGVTRIVYVSSSGVIGEKPGGGPGDEITPPGDAVKWNRYFASKLAVERAIAEFQKAHSIGIIQILPGWMFGPQDRAPTGSGQLVLNYLRRRIYARIGGGSNAVDARDVADSMIRAVASGRPGEKYLVGGTYMTLDDIMTGLERVSGLQAPRIRLPYLVALILAAVSYQYGRLTKTEVLITPETVRLMQAELKVDSSKAQRELGVTFRPFIDTLRDEVAWFRENDYV